MVNAMIAPLALLLCRVVIFENSKKYSEGSEIMNESRTDSEPCTLLFLVLGLEYINHTYIRKIGERSRMTR